MRRVKKHTIYFSIGEKKMKITVEAENDVEALKMLRSKISIDKIEVEKPKAPQDTLDNILKQYGI